MSFGYVGNGREERDFSSLCRINGGESKWVGRVRVFSQQFIHDDDNQGNGFDTQFTKKRESMVIHGKLGFYFLHFVFPPFFFFFSSFSSFYSWQVSAS